MPDHIFRTKVPEDFSASQSSVSKRMLIMENLPKKDSFGLRQEFRIPDTAPLICGVGRLAEQKDWNSFLSVCAGIHNVLPICHFLAVGDGSLRDALKQRGSELGLDNNLHWLGARTDARRIIGGSDLFLFPSLHDLFIGLFS